MKILAFSAAKILTYNKRIIKIAFFVSAIVKGRD
jgi:hypothetical protein